MKTSFTELLGALHADAADGWQVTIPENWMQGRTSYGGLSTALCLQAVENSFNSYSNKLPPLRSAQISFIGPAGGAVSIKTKIMRQGRSVSYVSAEMFGERGLATHAVFCFGTKRDSNFNQDFCTAPTVPSVESCDNFFINDSAPVFTTNFESRLASGGYPVSGSDKSEHYIWARNKDASAVGTAALLGLADMLPPAILPMFKEFAPISSMTWMLNFLDDKHISKDGWWLLRTAAEHAKDGYSSQDMQVWNADRELVISGRQNVAIFY